MIGNMVDIHQITRDIVNVTGIIRNIHLENKEERGEVIVLEITIEIMIDIIPIKEITLHLEADMVQEITE